jgi:RNA polymerase sigma-70 factor (ECF subfamily)
VDCGSAAEPSEDDDDPSDLDSALLVRARTDPAAFGELYDRNVRTVLAFFAQRTASQHVAADLTAETFTVMLAGLERYQPSKGAARSWMFGIATNLYRQWVRRGRVETDARRKLGGRTALLDVVDVERVEAAVDLEQYANALPRALEQLSPSVRDALRLRILHQMPYREIAARLGCSEISARVRVSRGLDRLLIALDRAV